MILQELIVGLPVLPFCDESVPRQLYYVCWISFHISRTTVVNCEREFLNALWFIFKCCIITIVFMYYDDTYELVRNILKFEYIEVVINVFIREKF